MSHTPGPWILDSPVYKLLVDRLYHFIDAGRGYCGDGEDGFGLSGVMSLADARLIVAAPELLEALDNCAMEMDLHAASLPPQSFIASDYLLALNAARERPERSRC
jgi:hypothetical protein